MCVRFFACVFVFLCGFEGTWGYPFQIGLKGSQRKLGPQFDTEAHDASATQLDLTRLKSSFSFAVSELDGYPPGEQLQLVMVSLALVSGCWLLRLPQTLPDFRDWTRCSQHPLVQHGTLTQGSWKTYFP